MKGDLREGDLFLLTAVAQADSFFFSAPSRDDDKRHHFLAKQTGKLDGKYHLSQI